MKTQRKNHKLKIKMRSEESKFKINRIVLSFTVGLTAAIGVTATLLTQQAGVRADGNLSAHKEIVSVVEWDVVSPNEAAIPKLSKIQLLGEIEKSIEAYQSSYSWEAKYCVTSRQAPCKDISVPEIITTSHVRIISNDAKWFYESKQETEDKTAKEKWAVNHRIASNGKVISMVWPDRNEAMARSKDQYKGGFGVATIADFLTCLSAESCLPKRADFPEVFEILGDPGTQLLPWYTRVGGQMCYVLERTDVLQQPIFRNGKELEVWKRENPEKAEAWSKAARYGLVFNIYPQGHPGGGDTRVKEMKFRLAIAPKLGFAIICWAYGYGVRSGAYQGFVFPDREIKYDDFRKVSKDLFIPHQMVYTNYRIDRHGQRDVMKETRLTVEEFTFNKQYQPELFEFDFPEGYKVTDADRGIIYTVGDSKEKIDALVAAAKAREAFYKRLSQTQAPALEPSEWLNSAPIVLAEQKGRAIILHFWGLGCAPSIHELPRLQRQYGHTAEFPAAPLFISIHPFVDSDHLKQLEKTLDKYGITFPVMVDSPDSEGRSLGKTFKKYRVFGIPKEVSIDEEGHFAEVDKDLISTSSWWFKNAGGK